jgi:hypothetical protein
MSGRKSNAGVIVGAVIGSLVLITILVAAALYLRRRSKARFRKLMMLRHPGNLFRPKHAFIPASDSESQDEQAFPSDEKAPIPLEETEASEPFEGSSSLTPTDVSRRPSDTSSLTPSTTATIRQQRLQEQEEANVMELASLEARISSTEWVFRSEYDAVVAEMTRLRAEMSWARDVQQSDWALGLTDEVPPPYSRTRVNSR